MSANSISLVQQNVFLIFTKEQIQKKARAFIAKLREWIIKIVQFSKVTDQKGVTILPGDVEEVTEMVMKSKDGKPFG